MILPLLPENSPILRTKSEEVKHFNQELKDLAVNLLETAKACKAVGISAVQCGVLKRVCLVSEDGKKFMALVNPTILEQKGQQVSFENCLSFRNKTCYVLRPKCVIISYQDLCGDIKRMEARDLLAAVCCHELDHNDGISMMDRSIKIVPYA